MAKVGEIEALAAYLGMGPGRSLEKLHRTFTGASPGISLRSLKTWSSKFGWGALAKAHDQRVTAKLVEKVEAAQIKEGVSAALMLDRFAIAGLTKAQALLETGATIADAEIIVDKAIEALKQLAVMTGGVSDRRMELSVNAGIPETPEQVRARRRAEIEAKYGHLGPDGDELAEGDIDPTRRKPH